MMSKYSGDKNYIYYPGTDIPINRLGIQTRTTLEKEEQNLLLQSYEYFHSSLSEDTLFDEDYLKLLQKKFFSKLYDFAGEYRNVNVSKGYSVFCQVRYLEQTSKRIFNELKRDNYLKDYYKKTKEDFAKKITFYLCELTALHPFYELNGRTIRLFFDMIATYNGYDYIDYSDAAVTKNGMNNFILASIECMSGNEMLMYDIIISGLRPSNQ
ncbi:MAG: hypothetical protein SCALA702_20610 [Melioribacteraceae bacterium]|nr:MAG: hypothetical protein SCALA702_20610 [Melioribacteraceae bacterium]